MFEPTKTTRRELVMGAAATAAMAALAPWRALAQAAIPQRRIPGTGEALPVIGLGSSKVVQEIAEKGTEPVAQVIRTLVANGGKLIDTWPRNAANDQGFGSVVSAPEFAGKLFLTTKIDQVGKDAGIAQFKATQESYRRQTLDLVQIFSLTDLEVHWPTLKGWKQRGAALLQVLERRPVHLQVREAEDLDEIERLPPVALLRRLELRDARILADLIDLGGEE